MKISSGLVHSMDISGSGLTRGNRGTQYLADCSNKYAKMGLFVLSQNLQEYPIVRTRTKDNLHLNIESLEKRAKLRIEVSKMLVNSFSCIVLEKEQEN